MPTFNQLIKKSRKSRKVTPTRAPALERAPQKKGTCTTAQRSLAVHCARRSWAARRAAEKTSRNACCTPNPARRVRPCACASSSRRMRRPSVHPPEVAASRRQGRWRDRRRRDRPGAAALVGAAAMAVLPVVGRRQHREAEERTQSLRRLRHRAPREHNRTGFAKQRVPQIRTCR